MKLINKSTNALSHRLVNVFYTLARGEYKDVPAEVAKVWLKIKGVEEYATPEDLNKIKEENEKLKKQIKSNKKSKSE